MDPRTAATRGPDQDAVEFIRFCYHRRRVGWPELYDEMCAVASRGLFRGYGPDDLADHGIGFGLFEMPVLAAVARQIVAEEQTLRRPVTVVLAPVAGDTVVIDTVVIDAVVTDAVAVASREPVQPVHPVQPVAATPLVEPPPPAERVLLVPVMGVPATA
jgi:hypothetical protein